jgi:O-antigen/teichoic acid export membrane protein
MRVINDEGNICLNFFFITVGLTIPFSLSNGHLHVTLQSMRQGGQYRRIAVNTLFQLASKVFSVALGLANVGLLTRYLGTEKYGWFTLVFTYVSFFTTLADVGYNQTIVREYSQDKNHNSNHYATLFNFKLILIACSIILALVALPFFPYDPALKMAIIIGVAAVSVSNLGSYGTSILQSQLRLDMVSILDLFTKGVTIALIILCVKLKLDFYAIVGTICVGNIIGLVVEYFLVKDWIVVKFQLDTAVIKRIAKISIPVGITAILSLLYFKIDTMMLSVMRTPTEVGIYSLAYKILDNALMVWALFMASVFPLLSKYYGSQDIGKYRDLVKKTLYILFLSSVGIIVLGNMFSPVIMRVLGGSHFFSSMEPFSVLLWSVPFLFLNNIFYNVILSFGKTKFLILPLVISLAFSVGLNLYAIPLYGYMGASYVTLAVEIMTTVIYTCLFFVYFKREASYLYSAP